MQLKAVLFDLDGTLIHFKIDYMEARRATISILEKNGYPKDRLTPNLLILSTIEKASEYFAETLHYSPSKIQRIQNQIGKKVQAVEKKAAQNASALDGIIPMLEYLQENNILFGIMTYNTTKNALISLKAAQLDRFFSDKKLIVGRDKVSHSKPHPMHAQAILDHLRVDPTNCLVMGDHPRDIETGVNIGASGIAIIRGEHKPEEFPTKHYVYTKEIPEKLIPLIISLQNEI